MRWAAPPGRGEREPVWRWLDRAAENLNPVLLVVAIMLAILTVSCYAALEIGRLHPLKPEAGTGASQAGAAALSRAAVARLPPD
jgi:hypothetical protein